MGCFFRGDKWRNSSGCLDKKQTYVEVAVDCTFFRLVDKAVFPVAGTASEYFLRGNGPKTDFILSASILHDDASFAMPCCAKTGPSKPDYTDSTVASTASL